VLCARISPAQEDILRPAPDVTWSPKQRIQDQEFHWVDLTKGTEKLYRGLVEEVCKCPDLSFSCFVADREQADPVERYSSPWEAYTRLAAQLLIGSIRRGEIVFVLADAYSSPHDVTIEIDVRDIVNKRLGRMAVPSVCRLDSRAADPLQVVDLLTSAVAFEFRQSLGLAGTSSPKARLCAHVKSCFGVDSFLKSPRTAKLNVAKYGEGPAFAGSSEGP